MSSKIEQVKHILLEKSSVKQLAFRQTKESFSILREAVKQIAQTLNEDIAKNMFFDDETTKFKLKFLGREDVITKFGIVPSMIFRPLVQSGRVFKEEESVTVWVSDDPNKLPIRIKANLAVGSIKADLDAFKGLKHTFKIKQRNPKKN